jgi:hypothetical protein
VPESRHRYAYGSANPVANWDPDGAFFARVHPGEDARAVAYRMYGNRGFWPVIETAGSISRIPTGCSLALKGEASTFSVTGSGAPLLKGKERSTTMPMRLLQYLWTEWIRHFTNDERPWQIWHRPGESPYRAI